jgi:hypothetical protein
MRPAVLTEFLGDATVSTQKITRICVFEQLADVDQIREDSWT